MPEWLGNFCTLFANQVYASPGHFHFSAVLPAVLGVITSVFEKLNNAVLSCKHVTCFGEIRKLSFSMKQRLSRGQTTIQ